MSSFNQQQESKQQGVEQGKEQTKERKREKITENSNQLDDLIIAQILSRLPVRSLLQFRCVCKSWRSLISDSHFIKTHLSCMSKPDEEDAYKHHRIIINRAYGLEVCSIYSVLYEPSVRVFDHDYPLHLKDPPYLVFIIGSCNGLLCIEIRHNLFIWNPTIRKSKKLPNSGIWDGSMAIGFGYDESVDDYKVVGLFPGGTEGFHETQVKVYTLRTDTWRRIQGFPFGEPFTYGKFVNKALHWPVGDSITSNFSRGIVSLHLEKETYKEVAQPKYSPGHFNLKLGILRGCLSVLCNYCESHADVWVMKEYGVKDSWTKFIKIPFLAHPEYSLYSAPLCIYNNGDILLEFGLSLVIYNWEEDTLRYPYDQDFRESVGADTCVESLVSPGADDELKEFH